MNEQEKIDRQWLLDIIKDKWPLDDTGLYELTTESLIFAAWALVQVDDLVDGTRNQRIIKLKSQYSV